MNTKYKIGENLIVNMTVDRINILPDGEILYQLRVKGKNDSPNFIMISENDIIKSLTN